MSAFTTSVPESGPNSLALLEPAELVALVQETGSRAALEQLVKKAQKPVYVTLAQLLPERQDVSDLTQEALLRMCRSLHSLRNPKTFKVWLNRIVTNLFYDELRKQGRRPNVVSLDAPLPGQEDEAPATRDVVDSAAQPDENSLSSELHAQIREAIARLPEPFRVIIVLREYQGLSYEEIAQLTQTQLGTVKSRLARARLRLQQELKPYLEASASS